MEVIKYLVFETTQSFEEWQKRQKRKIKDAVPVMLNSDTITTYAKYGVFVTYWENS